MRRQTGCMIVLGLLILGILGSLNGFCSIRTINEYQSPRLALINLVLIDGIGAKPVAGKCILIRDGKIEMVFDEGVKPIPPEYRIIDLAGKTVLPGFINTHVHGAYNEAQLQKWLVSGVTTVRALSVGNGEPADYLEKRELFNRNLRNARLVSANPILTKVSGYGKIQINSPEEAREKTGQLIDQGVDVIKIAIEDNLQQQTWAILTLDEIKAITETAHARNKRVVAHISHVHNLRLGIDGGIDEFAHMVVEPIPADLIREIVAKNIYFVPTLELWQGVSRMHGLVWHYNAMENVERFVKAGGKIAFGTDFAGYRFSFDDGFPVTEVELMRQAGMSPLEIIVAATRNAAFVCGLGDVLGTVETGKIADLIVVKDNPLEDLATLYDVQMVIHNGTIVHEIKK